jgi:hypothetical protein
LSDKDKLSEKYEGKLAPLRPRFAPRQAHTDSHKQIKKIDKGLRHRIQGSGYGAFGSSSRLKAQSYPQIHAD